MRQYTLEELEDTKGALRVRKSKVRKNNVLEKKDKRTNNELHIHIKPMIE